MVWAFRVAGVARRMNIYGSKRIQADDRPSVPVQMTFDFLLGIPLFDRLAFIVILFPFSETDLQLGISFFVEKDAERHQRITLFLQLALQLAQFALLQQ